MWNYFKPELHWWPRRCCTEAFCFFLSVSLPHLEMISGYFRCIPGQGEGTFIDLFPSFLTIVSFHLPPQVMAALIPSQTINSGVLWDPSPALPRSCHSPGRNSSPCSHLLSRVADEACVWLADDDCTDSFTPNQVARMHCYLDLVYQSWQPTKKPAPVAIAPQIVARTSTSVTLEWFPPIDGHFFERWSCSALYFHAGRMGRGELEDPLQECILVVCYAQPGLRLFPKLVHTEEVIDLLSALPFSACSTQLKAIDLPCKGQIFLHMLWEEFSIKDSSPVIPAVVAA